MPLCRAVQRASPGSLRHANPPRSKKARNHERTHTSLAHNCERRSYSHAAPPTQAHTSLPPSPPIVFHHTPRHPQPLVHLSPKDREQCLSAFICLAHTHTHTRIPPGWAIIDTSAAAKSSTHMLPTTLLAGRCQTAQFKSSSTYSRHTGQLMAGCRCSTGFGHAHKQGNKAPRVKKAVNTSRHTSMAVHAMLNPRQKRHSLLQK